MRYREVRYREVMEYEVRIEVRGKVGEYETRNS